MKKDLTAHATDRAAQSVREARKAAGLFSDTADHLRRHLGDVQEQTRRVIAEGLIDDLETNRQLNRVWDRCDRLREFINMMEAGSFRIQVDHAMEDAWKRLP